MTGRHGSGGIGVFRCRRLSFLLVFLSALSLLSDWAIAQSPAPVMVRQPVDVSVRTKLVGNTHPLARAESDRGEAPSDLPMKRMLLVLKRASEQEADLRSLIDDQQDTRSPRHHHWLTSEEYGARFGPADSDVAAVTNWLAASGFEVTQVSRGRTVIEFSGTAGLVKQAFGTAIHKYFVNGEEHWANGSDPTIPGALAPVVAGIASLNDFHKKPHYTVTNKFPRNDTQYGGPLSLFTFGSQGLTVYGVSPWDFATIYNVTPLWNAGITGAGQSIAIVSETDINIQDISTFRAVFGLPANDPTLIQNGPDPGILQDGEETEAVLDVSWAGAVATNATIDLVVSESTNSTQGIDLSALYVVDNNLAPVMSESYGACEASLGNANNAFYYGLWEQAAAQGITVVISAGDGGSAGCDDFNTASVAQFGLAVSGIASTPFNVTVGGSDFDQFQQYSTYWNSGNAAPGTGESAKSYIPETTWNDSCAGFGGNQCNGNNAAYFDIIAGSGGPSSCSTQNGSGVCTSGYGKAAWQTGVGVPNDGVRDTPDVSLFASDGFNYSIYVICESDISTSPSEPSVRTAGGRNFGLRSCFCRHHGLG
jgi:subtilase family serine protease